MIADTKALMNALALARTQDTACSVRPTGDGGWEVFSASPDGVSMVDIRLTAGVFPEGTDGTPEVFVADLDRWTKALRTVGPTVAVEFDGEGAGVVLKGEGMKHTLRLPAVQEDKRRFRVPDLSSKLTAQCMLEAERVRRLLSAVDEKRSDDLMVKVRDGTVTMSSYDDMGVTGVELSVGAADDVVADGEGAAGYPYNGWADLMRAVPQDAVLDIRLGDDMPCVVGLAGRDGEVTWLCAPRIAQE